MRSKHAKRSVQAHNENTMPLARRDLHERQQNRSELNVPADPVAIVRHNFNIGSSACKGVVNSLARDIATQ